ncbi:MAG: protease HtpX [Betaproteobacteria bacterium]
MFKRIVLFLLTNLAIILLLNVTLRLFGVDRIFDQNGINYTGLLILSLVIGFGGSFISLAMSKWSAKWMTKARVISQPANEMERWLLETVAAQSKRAYIGMPEVAIYDAPEINAFATGMNKNASLVAVSTGLLEKMTRDEIEAVLGHEIAHIANGDMITLALIQGVVNTFVVFLARVIGYVVDSAINKGRRGPGIGYWVATIVAEIVLGILASTIVMWFSRQREFRADEGGAFLAGRDKMVMALKKLQSAYEPSSLPKQMQAFGVSGNTSISRLFMSHPPLSERIEALENIESSS